MGDAETDTGKSFAGEGPKKKALTQFCHWARPKSALYEYNYDYGSYYYRPMIDYLNSRSQGARADTVKPLFWEERALKSYMDRSRRTQSCRVNKDTILLQNIRNSNSHYVAHSKSYARKITGLGF
ncbi:paramyosin, short form [Folsomia candida]|uniref:Flightin n=1 Tax=Folsomia candida TaxID=158441 RepID=A0A226F0H5_FOLCA|nr:paramyosin, short form [Folsomia candida]OXA62897.1 Flightin [Folsomia candida]